MAGMTVGPLADDISFGSRVGGLMLGSLEDAAICQQLQTLLDERGVILFDDVEQTSDMQRALSRVFGPMKVIAAATGDFIDRDDLAGIVDIRHDPENAGIVEIDGEQLSQWLPWHFDHCYTDELWRAAVLRPVTIPPNGGSTGFVDGIDMYACLPPALRERIEGKNILYTLDVLFEHMRFGRPDNFREIRVPPDSLAPSELARQLPRALHPAVWTRSTGEKVLHISPWMAVGIEHEEDDEGDALLEAVCKEMIARATPYFHHWQPTEMLVWDNWRVLHSVTGTHPTTARRMHRTTIKGDYGLGRFENGAARPPALSATP